MREEPDWPVPGASTAAAGRAETSRTRSAPGRGQASTDMRMPGRGQTSPDVRVASRGLDYAAAMRLALDEARAALQHDDVPIGAVVIDAGGQVIGRGHNTRERDTDPTAHAEITALREASAATGDWQLTGATLVVTLEPCTMCAGAAVLARVRRVIFGAVEPKTGAVVSLWDVVRDPRLNHRPEVLGPWDLPEDLTEECAGLLRDFFVVRREPR